MSEPVHVVQFSLGASSAEAALRRVQQVGADHVVLLTADTLVEDEDNWRFAEDVMAYFAEHYGRPEWTVLADGRTPMQVGRDRKVVPNNRMAVCSEILKRRLLRVHLDENYDPTTTVVDIGFDWDEPHRLADARRMFAHRSSGCRTQRLCRSLYDEDGRREGPGCGNLLDQPWTVAAPLAERPFLNDDADTVWRARGIEPPRLYSVGFPHANCGGACVRGGQREWARLLRWNRPRYLEWESEEVLSRDVLGADVAILRDRRGGTVKPLPLTVFRRRLEGDATAYDESDVGACGCQMTFEDMGAAS